MIVIASDGNIPPKEKIIVSQEEKRYMKEAIIQTKNLTKCFKTGDVEQTIIDHLDLEIYKGDFTVIMGSSGAGKSTLL